MRIGPALLLFCAALSAQFHLPGSGGGASKPAKPPAQKPVDQEPVSSAGVTPGFDYYVLSLSWAPAFCADAGNAARSPNECASGRRIGFVVHGLWPESDGGRGPESCENAKSVSKAVLNSLLPYMLGSGLIQHEWQTHGTCSGLSQADYFTDVIKARVAVQLPVQFTALDGATAESPEQIESQFAQANPSFPPRAFRAMCNGSDLTEVRACFARDLAPRECSASAGRCAAGSLRIAPPR